MALKLVISDPKTGFSVQKEIADDAAKSFMGLKIGDKAKGELIDLQGYEFEVTGGSDFCGFPMRRDVQGTGRKKLLAYTSIGFRKVANGILQRKTVCGNTVHPKIAQLNLKALSVGSSDIFSEVKKKVDDKKAKKAEPAAVKEAPAPQKESKEAPAPKKEEKAEVKKEEKPAKAPAADEKPAKAH